MRGCGGGGDSDVDDVTVCRGHGNGAAVAVVEGMWGPAGVGARDRIRPKDPIEIMRNGYVNGN
jgi:hypothetical protein